MNPALAAAFSVNASAIGLTPTKGEGYLKTISDWWDKIGPLTLIGGGGRGKGGLAALLGRSGDALLSGIGASRVREWQGAFQRDFPPHHDTKTAPADSDDYPFTGRHKRGIQSEIDRHNPDYSYFLS